MQDNMQVIDKTPRFVYNITESGVFLYGVVPAAFFR